MNLDSVPNGSWVGAVDEFVVHDTPYNLYSAPKTVLNAEAIVAGFNSMDGPAGFYGLTLLDGDCPTTERSHREKIGGLVSNKKLRKKVLSTFYPPKDFKKGYSFHDLPPSFNKYQLAWFTLNGDVCVICPTLKLAQQIAANAITPDLFVYDFKGPGYDDLYSAAHGSELMFLFETLRWVEPDFFKIPW